MEEETRELGGGATGPSPLSGAGSLAARRRAEPGRS